MARPTKTGLEYFALDVKMDDAVNIIEAEHGLVGFAIIIKLFQRIYNEGYYYKWTEKEQILFSSRVSVDRNLVTTIVEDCIKWGIFNQELYENHTILTSRRIQNHYLTATYKRVNVEMVKEYLLIDVSDRKNINVIRVSDDRNPSTTKDTDDKSTQSKVKESKVKESKAKNNARAQKPKPEKIKYADFVSLTNAEYKALVAKLGEEGTERCIEILDNYKGAMGKRYKSDYRAILNWVVERYEEEQRRKQHDKSKTSNPFLELAKEEGLL